MQAVFHVQSPQQVRRKFWLHSREQLSVGRTELADLALPDPQLADIHFALHTDGDGCRLRALAAKLPTLVNGQAVEQCRLRHGDVIQAGRTEFRVELDDSGGAGRGRNGANGSADAPPGAVPLQPPTPPATAAASTATALAEAASAGRPAGLGMFLAVLQVESGPETGRKLWLRDNELLQVGRTELADLALPRDPQLTAVHFSLRTRDRRCWICDIDSDSGVLVNDRVVGEPVPVRTGDRLRAGTTVFRVTMECGREDGQGQAAEDPRLAYCLHSCTSGLPCYRPAGSEPTPIDAARMLAEHRPLHLVVNTRRLAVQLPEPIVHSSGLAARQRAGIGKPTLLLLSHGDPLDLPAMLGKAWGRDALIAIFSDLDKPALKQALCRCLPSFTTPRILRTQLTQTSTAFARNLMQGMAAVLLESERNVPWELLAHPDIAPHWSDLGLPVPPQQHEDRSGPPKK